jgi:CheY-like chemotaxis protein
MTPKLEKNTAPGHPGAATLMIVDDDDEIRKILEKGCTQAGYRVLLADNGLRLVSTLRSEKVDVVLLDINMPWVSGVEVGKAIKRDPGLKQIKVVYVTGVYEREAECLETGCDGFIRKPFSIRLVLETIETLLGPPNP